MSFWPNSSSGSIRMKWSTLCGVVKRRSMHATSAISLLYEDVVYCIIEIFSILFSRCVFGYMSNKFKLRCLTHQKDCRRVPQSDPGLDVISLLVAGSPCIVTWLVCLHVFFDVFFLLVCFTQNPEHQTNLRTIHFLESACGKADQHSYFWWYCDLRFLHLLCFFLHVVLFLFVCSLPLVSWSQKMYF